MRSVLVALEMLRVLELRERAVGILSPVADMVASRMTTPWWRWTAYLAVAITTERICTAARQLPVARSPMPY